MSPSLAAEQKRKPDASTLLFVFAWLIGLAGGHPGTFGFGRGFEMASPTDERGWQTGRRFGVSARAHPRLYPLVR